MIRTIHQCECGGEVCEFAQTTQRCGIQYGDEPENTHFFKCGNCRAIYYGESIQSAHKLTEGVLANHTAEDIAKVADKISGRYSLTAAYPEISFALNPHNFKIEVVLDKEGNLPSKLPFLAGRTVIITAS